MRVRELGLDVADARFNEALALLCRVVFGVFGDVAVQASLADRAHDRRPLDGLEALQLRPESLRAGGGHRVPFHVACVGTTGCGAARGFSRRCSACVEYGTSSRRPCMPIAAARAPAIVVYVGTCAFSAARRIT